MTYLVKGDLWLNRRNILKSIQVQMKIYVMNIKWHTKEDNRYTINFNIIKDLYSNKNVHWMNKD